eukprot:scaffold61705_cov59-Cyclotella_meneghiniana.AAC.3
MNEHHCVTYSSTAYPLWPGPRAKGEGGRQKAVGSIYGIRDASERQKEEVILEDHSRKCSSILSHHTASGLNSQVSTSNEIKKSLQSPHAATMRGERLAVPRLASLVTRPDQNAPESPLCLHILTIMAMRPLLLLNHDPADFVQPRAYVIALNTYRYV